MPPSCVSAFRTPRSRLFSEPCTAPPPPPPRSTAPQANRCPAPSPPASPQDPLPSPSMEFTNAKRLRGRVAGRGSPDATWGRALRGRGLHAYKLGLRYFSCFLVKFVITCCGPCSVSSPLLCFSASPCCSGASIQSLSCSVLGLTENVYKMIPAPPARLADLAAPTLECLSLESLPPRLVTGVRGRVRPPLGAVPACLLRTPDEVERVAGPGLWRPGAVGVGWGWRVKCLFQEGLGLCSPLEPSAGAGYLPSTRNGGRVPYFPGADHGWWATSLAQAVGWLVRGSLLPPVVAVIFLYHSRRSRGSKSHSSPPSSWDPIPHSSGQSGRGGLGYSSSKEHLGSHPRWRVRYTIQNKSGAAEGEGGEPGSEVPDVPSTPTMWSLCGRGRHTVHIPTIADSPQGSLILKDNTKSTWQFTCMEGAGLGMGGTHKHTPRRAHTC